MKSLSKKLSKTNLDDTAKNDTTRRPRQEAKRKESQAARRPEDAEARAELEKDFSNDVEKQQWASRPPWFKKGKHQQGLNLLFADPEPLRGTAVSVVNRSKSKYSITIGFSQSTGFDPTNLRMGVQCSTVSGSHAKLNFERKNGLSTVFIEDLNSLNGTFVLGRPPATSNERPMLEKEVRGEVVDLRDIEYIRLGSACVLVPDHTNIYCDDADESDSDEEEEDPNILGDEEGVVDKWLADGWYLPAPCHPRVREITQRKRASPKAEKRSKNKKSLANAV